MSRWWVAAVMFIMSWGVRAQEVRTLLDFESPADVRVFDLKQKSASLSSEHATHGKRSLKISANEYLNTFRFARLVGV